MAASSLLQRRTSSAVPVDCVAKSAAHVLDWIRRIPIAAPSPDAADAAAFTSPALLESESCPALKSAWRGSASFKQGKTHAASAPDPRVDRATDPLLPCLSSQIPSPATGPACFFVRAQPLLNPPSS
ncbi:uncharacterized protein LOC119268403 [Triticum dicoccoides]|uniref:uncharacterized protein LOC119268403 n=1 Tax=Triticum dicoccoides TaxID=85692 RepID=UPI00188DC7DC|nr:uncharacterized protein LOC119268403 [Triticum dicoccoides]